MSIIRNLFIRLFIWINTGKSQRWIFETYSRICDLQFEDWKVSSRSNWQFKAYGSYLEFKHENLHFVLNEVKKGISCNYHQLTLVDGTQKWEKVYETGKFISDYFWISMLLCLDIELTEDNVYYTRAKELKDTSQWA